MANLYKKLVQYLKERYNFRYNTILNNVEQVGIFEVECAIDELRDPFWQPLKDGNLQSELYEADFEHFLPQYKVLMQNEQIVLPYNPISNYFNFLSPYREQEGDYIKGLLNFITLDDETRRPFFEQQVTKWLCRTVACALGRIKVNKQCLTFIGKQNDGKTHFFRFLVPTELQEYYAENVNVTKNDGEFSLTQSFLINWDEMAQFSKHEITAIKTFMTKENVRQRRPYGTKTEVFRRIASFVGSTNEEEILNDHTGNSRFLCFKIVNINHDNGGKNGYCSVNMDNVYRQVMYLLDKKDFNINMTAEDMKMLEGENQKFKKTTVEGELVARHLVPDNHLFNDKIERETVLMTATEIQSKLIFTYPEYNKINTIALGKVLVEQGFTKIQTKNTNNVPMRYWKVIIIKPFADISRNDTEPPATPEEEMPF